MSKKQRRIFDKLPFEVVDTEYEDVLNEGQKSVAVGPKKYIIPEMYKDWGLDIYNFEARPDDIYLMGFIRSGTTLHSEMIWLIGNDLNYESANANLLDYRFPHIDFSVMGTINWIKNSVAGKKDDELTEEVKNIVKTYDELTLKGIAGRKYRRFIKSHLPVSLMPPHVFEVGAKIIYCARNPKDVVVSAYNSMFFFGRKNDPEKYTFKQCFDEIKNDAFWLCPYFEHVKEAWARRNDDNFLFLFYEDTLKNKKETILTVADFLGKKLSNEELETLIDHLSFENFETNESVNCNQFIKTGVSNDDSQRFIRKGKIGSWKEYFQGDFQKELDEWVEKNLVGSDIVFPKV